jgi:glutamine amidotransferase-like uncharacterized protein
MPERFVAVYHDEGTGELSRGCLSHALACACSGRARVRRIDAAEVAASDGWHVTTALLAIPGGADLPYCARLNGAGNASILRYLERGGRFLGVCAGAYYASARVSFEPSSAGAVTGVRELALLGGTARGSLHDLAAPYALDHLRCADVTRVYAPSSPQELHALYWGGPELVPDAGASYVTLLTYPPANGRGRIAALRTDVGRGRVVLTGVHAEITGAQFAIEVSRNDGDSFEHGMRISARLTELDLERQRTFDLLIAALELD